jgi:hypothetical protein
VFAGVFGFPRPRKPAPQSLPCACACGEDHDLPPALAAVLAQRRAGPEASPEVSARDWAPAFADEVRQGQVINIPRSDVAGLALSVLRVRTHEEGGEFGGAAVTFLAVNVADPSMPVAPTLSIHAGLRIAVSAPDSLAGMGGVS